MKMTTGILGCALVAGLMTFAADKAQAGVVIGNTLYSPLKLKITVQYIKNGKVAKASVTAKQILKDLGWSDARQLAVSRDTGDVWVLNKKALVTDISSYPNDYLFVNLNWYDYGYTGKNDNTYNESGVAYVNFYDDGYEANYKESSNWFEISGAYTYKDVDGPVKNGSYQDNESMKANALSGDGYFSNVDFDYGSVPVTGSASYNGNGKLAVSSL